MPLCKGDVKIALIGFASIFSSSMISAIGFILIASGRWPLLESNNITFVILFVQWQTLGLTIAKLGVEQMVFASVSSNANTYIDPLKYIRQNAIVLSGLFSLVMYFVFTPLASFIAFATIILDTYSIIIISDLNARRKYTITSISNILNYPLFFIMLVILKYLGYLNINSLLVVFLVTSLGRSIWLHQKRYIAPNMEEMTFDVHLQMGAQQVLNYILFRADQVLLAVAGLTSPISEHVTMYIFMSRFPELISNIMLIAGTIVFPAIYIRYPFKISEALYKLSKYTVHALAYMIIIVIAALAYGQLWKGSTIPLYMLVSFSINAASIVLINNITYSMLRQGYVSGLVRNLIIAVMFGLIPTILLFINLSIKVLSFVVPIQVVVFILLTIFASWECGKSHNKHSH